MRKRWNTGFIVACIAGFIVLGFLIWFFSQPASQPGSETLPSPRQTDWVRRPEPSRIPLENPVSPTWPEVAMESGVWEVRFMNGLYEARPWGIQSMRLPEGSSLVGGINERTLQLGHTGAVLKWDFVTHLQDHPIDRAEDFPASLSVSIWNWKTKSWTRATEAAGASGQAATSGEEVLPLYFACDAEGGGAYLFTVTPASNQDRMEVQKLTEKTIESLVLGPRQEGAKQQQVDKPRLSFFLPQGWRSVEAVQESHWVWEAPDSRMSLRLELMEPAFSSSPEDALQLFQDFAQQQFDAQKSTLQFERLPDVQVGERTYYLLRSRNLGDAGGSGERSTQMAFLPLGDQALRCVLFSTHSVEQGDAVMQLVLHTIHRMV